MYMYVTNSYSTVPLVHDNYWHASATATAINPAYTVMSLHPHLHTRVGGATLQTPPPPGQPTYLHVVEDEEESLDGESLEELKGVEVWRRVLMVVVVGGIGRPLEVGSVSTAVCVCE